MPDIPLLSPRKATMAKEYVAELRTVSGATHRLGLIFEVPCGPDGLPDLGRLKDFDPEAQAVGNIVDQISKAHADPVIFADRAAMLAQKAGNGARPQRQPVSVEEINGKDNILWRHVESFRFLGLRDEVEAAEKARQRQQRIARAVAAEDIITPPGLAR